MSNRPLRPRKQTSRLDDTVRKIINAIFLPMEIAGQIFSKTTLYLIGVLFIVTIVVAAPPLRETIVSTVFNVQCLPDHTRELGKQYSDFAVIVFQVLVALVIGGILITDKIAKLAQYALDRYQSGKGTALSIEQRELLDRLYSEYVLVRSHQNLVSKIIGFTNYAWKLYGVMFVEVPRFYVYTLPFKFLSSFPQGFYGAVAFFLFEGLLLSQVSKMYFEYLPACTVAPIALI